MADPELGPIEQTPLRAQVASRIRTAIVTGKLRPGAALTETALAEQLNVSRAPIREAIQDLENEGLVETLAYWGKRVKPLTLREVSEIREMRQHVEVMAVRRIVGRTLPPSRAQSSDALSDPLLSNSFVLTDGSQVLFDESAGDLGDRADRLADALGKPLRP